MRTVPKDEAQPRAGAWAAVLAVCLAVPLPAWGTAAASEPPAAVRASLGELRRSTGCPVAPGADAGGESEHLGRPAIVVVGLPAGDEPAGAPRDRGIFDRAAARMVSYVCFANASTRRGGEAIISLAEASGRADRLVRLILPGSSLELESIERRRDGESVYYEAGYATAPGAIPLLEAPVRLSLDASTGSFYRLDVEPGWLDPPAVPRVMISRKAAEKIAAVLLAGRDFGRLFGRGARLGNVARAELFTVRPNGWLGLLADPGRAPARVAFVVPFNVLGGEAPGLHRLFVDAATGRVLGGLGSRPAGAVEAERPPQPAAATR
jgi:hypothetical protein